MSTRAASGPPDPAARTEGDTALVSPRQPVFPFFVGCGRSGTTLLRAMLDSHSQLAVTHETYFALWMGWNHRRYDRSGAIDVDGFVTDFVRTVGPGRLDVGAEELTAELHRRAPADTLDAIRIVYALHAAKQGKPRYAEKQPRLVLHIARFAELFPEARFVHIIRDGRDVALAFKDVDFGPTTAASGALHWSDQVSRGREDGQRLGPERYLEIHYEELIDDARPVLERICRFIDLPFEESMLRYYERAGAVVSKTGNQGYHTNLYRPPTKGLRDWRTQMTRRDVAQFEALAGGLLEDLGYERSVPSVPPIARAEAQLQRLGYRTGAAIVTGRTKVAKLRRVVMRQP